MTNVAATDATAISDERLMELAEKARQKSVAPDFMTFMPELALSLITELQERRRNTLPTSVTDEKVEAVSDMAPFKHGDRVDVGTANGLVVEQCWLISGEWNVLAYGKPNKDNPRGRYTFAASDARRGVTDAMVEAAIVGYCNALKDVTARMAFSDLHTHDRIAMRAALSASLPPSRDDAVGVKAGLEAAARALCLEKGINPDALHFGTSDQDISDHTDVSGKTFYYGWRNQVKYASAVLSALEPAQQPIDRATVIEECAKWHDVKAAVYRKLALSYRDEGNAETAEKCISSMSTHETSAKAIRALSDKEPTNGN